MTTLAEWANEWNVPAERIRNDLQKQGVIPG
jgi:hypothetical protein